MKHYGTFILLVLFFGISSLFAQTEKKIEEIYPPEGMNITGNFIGWQNPPTDHLPFAGIEVTNGKFVVDKGLATQRYKTTINVQASGGDITGQTSEWLFTSGSTGNPWGNKWGGVTVTTDAVQSYTLGGGNNSVTVANGNYYTVVFQDNGYANSNGAWLKTSAAPVSITAITGFPTSVATNTAVTCSVQVSGTLSAEEKVYIRYSTDNFASNYQSVQVTNFDGTTHIGTATIPGQTTNGTTISFYALSTTVASASWGTQNVDLLTLSYKKNGSLNYSYDIAPITSIAAGNWSSASTWNTGVVPPASATVFVNTAVTLDADVTLAALTINAAGSLGINTGKTLNLTANATLTNSGTLNVNAGTLAFAGAGTITNSGTFNGGSGTVSFGGASTISNTGTFSGSTGTFTFSNTAAVTGTVGLNNVNLSNGGDFGTATTLNGVLTLNSGGYINNNHPPIYASTSTLKYNTGGTYGRWLEWSATSGAGYPGNVQVSNNTTVDLGNSGTAVARQIAGTLTIDAGSALTTNGTGNQMSATFTVLGGVTNNGTLTLSSVSGGDLTLAGNFTNNGTFTGNGRAVQFNGATAQTIGGTGTIAIDNLNINNAAGVTLTQDVTVNNQLLLNSGLLTLGAKNLTLGASATLGGTPSATAMVNQNSTGLLRKQFSTVTSFTFPIGTTSGTAFYSPVAVNFASGTYGSGAYLTATVTAAKQANNTSTTNYLNRYWTLTQSGITAFSATVTGTYAASDVAGSESVLYGGLYNGTAWSPLNKVNATTHQVSGTITSFGALSAGEAAVMNLSTYTSVADGNWNTPATWDLNAVPSVGATVTINNAVTLNPSTNVNINSLTINTGKSFNLNGNTLTIAGGGSLVNNGTFTHSNGTVIFGGAGTVTGTVSFYNLTVGGLVNPGTAATINGTLTVNTGGAIITNAPTYASGSLLKYNTGGTYLRDVAWSTTSGAGYPQNVQLSNNTLFDLGANSGTAIAEKVAGNLTIDAGSGLTMNNTGNLMTASLTVVGNITNNGTITLSGSAGGDLNLNGNFINNGTFNCNTRALFLSGSTLQTISGTASATTIDFLIVNNTSGIALSQDVVVNSQLTLTNGLITLGSKNLTLGTGTVVNWTPSVTKMIVATGTGQLRKLYSATGSFTFPVGNTSGTAAYTPVTVNFASGTFGTGGYVGVNVTTAKHPQNTSATNYLNRYWTLSSSAISAFSATVTGNYVATDVTGAEASIIGGEYANLVWNPFAAVNTTAHTLSGTVSSFGDFSGGEAASMNTVPYVSVANGGWKTPATWNNNSIPPSGARVTIAHDITLDTNATVSALIINSGKTFTASDASGRVLTIASGDTINNSGTFAHGNGTVTFAGSGLVIGTVSLNNVNISNGVNFGTATTVNGTLSINAGGYINTNPPIYGTGSTLKYNTGGTYGRYLEFSAITGAGYPYNVQVSNNTVVDLGNGAVATARKMAGSLTVDAGSTFSTNNGSNQMTATLTILGNVINNGTITLSTSLGADLNIAGNFTNNGTFTPNSREVVLNGSTLQTIATGASSTTTLEYLAVSGAAGATLGTLKDNLLTIANRVRFATGSGSLNTGTDTLVLAAAATITGETSTNYIVGTVKTTQTVGTASYVFSGLGLSVSAGNDLGSVTVKRVSGTAGTVTVDGVSGINRKWQLSTTATGTINRSLSFTWLSAEDNGINLAKTAAYQSTNDGSSWTMIGTTYQDATSSRTTAAPVTTLGWFTVTDSARPLMHTSFTLNLTALHEGYWNGSVTKQDTFTVEIHGGSSPFALITSAKALNSTAGLLTYSLTGLSNGTPYYIMVKGRNTIKTWSATPLSFTGYSLSYDFTSAGSQAYGSNQTLKNGKYCLYTGDIDQSQYIDNNDLLMIDNDAFRFATGSYVGQLATDVDGSLFVDNNDLLYTDNNAFNFVGEKSPLGTAKAQKQTPAPKTTEK